MRGTVVSGLLNKNGSHLSSLTESFFKNKRKVFRYLNLIREPNT